MKIKNLNHLVAMLMLLTTTGVLAADTVRVAMIEMLSGPGAGIGTWLSHHFRWAVDQLNASGGVLGAKVEVVEFDNKSSPQEALLALKRTRDEGIRFVFGGSSSNIAIALSDAIAKQNARDPASAQIFLNYTGLDPSLTNEKCNFWHFRFDAHVGMKLEALTNYVAAQKDLKKVYLLNQDYAYGQSVQKDFREMLKRKRPDIEILGDELHALQKVKDFAPYVAKIHASGAQAVLTGNWGPDLALLIRASQDAGLPAKFYTLNAHFTGTPTAIGSAGANRVLNVSPWHANARDSRLEENYLGFKQRYNEEWNMLPVKIAVDMWAAAIANAKSTGPVEVGKALEGLRLDSGTGSMLMRADDHQLLLPHYAYLFTNAGGEVKHDLENLGFGFRTEARYESDTLAMPSSCKMERP
ncbi:MAG: branched-chain amino acid ABC transporter substrate-binding protein [Burkholderiales bacterium]